MNITEKLLKARKLIKETSIQKEGRNTFSKYDYFTPSQVSELVNDVCQELKILVVFSLRKDEYGLFGELQLTNLLLSEDGGHETLTTQMRTEMPSITATNMTQQMGGCETYTKRYMLMSAFDITDNNLDFDSQDNRPKASPPPPQVDPETELDILSCNTIEELERFFKGFNAEEQKLYSKIVTDHKLKISLNKK